MVNTALINGYKERKCRERLTIELGNVRISYKTIEKKIYKLGKKKNLIMYLCLLKSPGGYNPETLKNPGRGSILCRRTVWVRKRFLEFRQTFWMTL